MERGSSKHGPELDEQMEREDESILRTGAAGPHRGVARARAVRPGAPGPGTTRGPGTGRAAGDDYRRCGAAVRHRPLAPAAQAARGPSTPCWNSCSTRARPTMWSPPSAACRPGGSSPRSARSSARSASTPKRTTQATRLPDHEGTQPPGRSSRTVTWSREPPRGRRGPCPPGGGLPRAVLPGPPRRGRREGCAPSLPPRAAEPAAGTNHGSTRPGPDQKSAPGCGSQPHANGQTGADPRADPELRDT